MKKQPVLTELNKQMAAADQEYKTAHKRIDASQEALKLAQTDKCHPYRDVDLKPVQQAAEKLFLDADTIMPESTTAFSAARQLVERNFTTQQIIRELGPEHRRDIELAQASNSQPLKFAKDGTITNLQNFLGLYEADAPNDLLKLQELSTEYGKAAELIQQGEFNLQRFGKLASFEPQEF